MTANVPFSKKSLQILPRAPPSTQFNVFFILTSRSPKAVTTLEEQMQMTPLALRSRRESETSREWSKVVSPSRALNAPFSNPRFYANLPGFPHYHIYVFIAVPAVKQTLLFPSFVPLATQTSANVSQCRTRLGNKPGSHERQQRGDFGASHWITTTAWLSITVSIGSKMNC